MQANCSGGCKEADSLMTNSPQEDGACCELITANEFVSMRHVEFTVAAEELIFLFKNTSHVLSTCDWIFNGETMDGGDGDVLEKKAIDGSTQLNADDYEFSVQISTLISTMEKLMEETLTCNVDKELMRTDVYTLFKTLVGDMEHLSDMMNTVFSTLRDGLSTLRDLQEKCRQKHAIVINNVQGIGIHENSEAAKNTTDSIKNSSLFSWNSLAGKLKFCFSRNLPIDATESNKNCIGNGKLAVAKFKRGRKSLFQVYPDLLFDKEENPVIPTFSNVTKMEGNDEGFDDKKSNDFMTIKQWEDKDYLNQKFYTVVQIARYVAIILKYKIASIEKSWKKCFAEDKYGKDIRELIDIIECYYSSANSMENQEETSLHKRIIENGNECIKLFGQILEEFRCENNRLLKINTKFLLI